MHGSTPEIDILQIAQIDKRRAFELAFSNFWEPLYRQAYRKTQSEDSSKDLTQEVFVVLWENLDRLGVEDKLLPYLYGVLRNKILALFEKDEVRLRYAMKNSGLEEGSEFSSHHILVGKELISIITDEVEKMPPRMKEIYKLKKEQYFSNKDIAEKLSLSEQTVKNQLQNAYQRLKVRLENYNSHLDLILILLLDSFL